MAYVLARAFRCEISKPRQIGKCDPAGMHVHAPELSAAVQCWKHLAGIKQTFVVERTF
jgi:hypothetical protein